jgi:hypothetical protein
METGTTPINLDECVSLGEAGHQLRRSDVWVRHLFDSGRLEGTRDPSGRRWITKASLAKMLAAERAKRHR